MHPLLMQIGSLAIPSYGVLAAAGVLAALTLSHWSCGWVGIDPRHGWNAIVLGVFAAMSAERGLLIALNLSNLRVHPRWLLALALVHHPLLTGVGTGAGLAAVWLYGRWAKVGMRRLADALAAPVAAGMALEQIGCLLAGSDYGREAMSGRWGAVTYTSELAARWSGTPLGIPLVPVQGYAALGAGLVAVLSGIWLRRRGDTGEAAGVGLLGMGVVVFLTECLRDWEGRGVIYAGKLGAGMDAPQVAALLMVVGGALLMARWSDGEAGGSVGDA
jgi:phosphatidylglycerol:prolipoprotein diacylglycerol transferase